jgi:uncharacterized membrane protein (UPF0127 family)
MNRRAAILIVAMFIAGVPLGASAAPAVPAWHLAPPFSTETAMLTLGGSVHVTAEIADTNLLRSRGLGDRDGLRDGWGMLFIDQTARVQMFWMKDMRFCLDIIWIDEDHITGAAQNVCPQPGASDSDLAVFSSGVPVRYVLEMPANWLKDNGLGAGSSVDISLPPSS